MHTDCTCLLLFSRSYCTQYDGLLA